MRMLKRPLPKLLGRQVLARLLEPREADMMARFRQENKAHLLRWEPRRMPEFYTEGFWQIHLRIALRDFRDGTSVSFVLLNPEETAVIGVCNYTSIVRGTFQACHLGYALAANVEGRGVMFEALQMTNQYMFDEFGLHRIMAGYLPENDRSGALLDRLGFEKEGLARRYLKINGHWEDHVLTSLINDDIP